MSQSLAMQEDAASICPYLHSEAEYRAFRLPGKILYTPFCYTQKKDRKGTILTIALFGLHGARAFASDSRYDVFFKMRTSPQVPTSSNNSNTTPCLVCPNDAIPTRQMLKRYTVTAVFFFIPGRRFSAVLFRNGPNCR